MKNGDENFLSFFISPSMRMDLMISILVFGCIYERKIEIISMLSNENLIIISIHIF